MKQGRFAETVPSFGSKPHVGVRNPPCPATHTGTNRDSSALTPVSGHLSMMGSPFRGSCPAFSPARQLKSCSPHPTRVRSSQPGGFCHLGPLTQLCPSVLIPLLPGKAVVGPGIWGFATCWPGTATFLSVPFAVGEVLDPSFAQSSAQLSCWPSFMFPSSCCPT